MNILYLVHQFYPEFTTGTEKFVLNTARLMQKQGHRVGVLTYGFYETDMFPRKAGNLLLRSFVYRSVPVTAFRHRKLPPDINIGLEDGDFRRVATEVLRHVEPDVIHVGHGMRVHEFIGAAIELGIPYIVTLTDFFFICPKFILLDSNGAPCQGPDAGRACRQLCPELPGDFIDRRLARAKKFLSRAGAVISPSEFVKTTFESEFDDLQIQVINHGLSYRNMRSNTRRYRQGDRIAFCFAGSFNRHKGLHLLLDAFRSLDSSAAELKVYGSGTDELYRQEIMRRIDQDERVEYAGTFSEDQVGEVLSRVDVVVLPSLWYENYPLILIEALACGIPVIASNLGGMAEKIRDGDNGFTFGFGEAAELREAMRAIVDNPEILNDRKRNIRRSFTPTIEQESYRYEQLYHRFAPR